MQKHSQMGVTMVEVALILPTLILMCFGVVDLLRISYFESMLQRAAADIAASARTSPNLDWELRELTINSGEYYDFYEGRKLALQPGLTSAAMSFSAPGTPSDAELIQTTQTDRALGNYTTPLASLTPMISSALVLRPGEEGQFQYVDDTGTTITEVFKHPIVPSDAAGQLPATRMDNLMDLAPIHVEIRARVKPILSIILGTRTVHGSATTYREKGIRRVAMVDSSGNDVKPLTATRRIRAPDPFIGTAPEPVEPLVVCGPSPGPGTLTIRWMQSWGFAMGQSSPPDTVLLDTTAPPGVCPPMWLSGSSSPMGL